MTAQTTPRRFSAGRALVLGFGGVLLLVVGLVGWSVLASISGAVVAGGRVEVENHNQVVEHIEGGTVSEILVRNGDRVAEGRRAALLQRRAPAYGGSHPRSPTCRAYGATEPAGSRVPGRGGHRLGR